jgi:hypothetical protein
VSFVADEYRFWLPVLESAIRVREDVGQELKHQCILEVLREATLTLTDWEAFLQHCEEVYERLAGRAKQEFVVVYAITYSGEPFFSRIVDGDVRIQWQPRPTSRFIQKVREARNGLAGRDKSTRLPTNQRTLQTFSHLCRPTMSTTLTQ